MEDILVSVIMPVHNSLEYLDASITSVLNQSLERLQLIIVDDGSDDGSAEKIDYYASIDNRITAIHRDAGGYPLLATVG